MMLPTQAIAQKRNIIVLMRILGDFERVLIREYILPRTSRKDTAVHVSSTRIVVGPEVTSQQMENSGTLRCSLSRQR